MRTNIKAITIAVLLLASTKAYSAEAASPPRYPLDVAPTPTMDSAPVSSLLLGSIVIVFGTTTLGEAIHQIKEGRIQHQGDAGESSYWLCYSIRTKGVWEQLWLLSHGEMGGDKHVIEGIVAKVTAFAPSTASCPELPDNLKPVKLSNGFWLGMEAEELHNKLGKPSLHNKHWIHYESLQKLVDDPRAKLFGAKLIYERGSLSVRSVNGVAVEIWSTKQTSY